MTSIILKQLEQAEAERARLATFSEERCKCGTQMTVGEVEACGICANCYWMGVYGFTP